MSDLDWRVVENARSEGYRDGYSQAEYDSQNYDGPVGGGTGGKSYAARGGGELGHMLQVFEFLIAPYLLLAGYILIYLHFDWLLLLALVAGLVGFLIFFVKREIYFVPYLRLMSILAQPAFIYFSYWSGQHYFGLHGTGLIAYMIVTSAIYFLLHRKTIFNLY